MKFGLFFFLFFVLPCCGQTTTGNAETTGPCSPAVTGSNNQFTINCQGIDKEQGVQFLKILNKISRDQLNPRIVLEKLDEIQKGVSNIQTDLAKKKQQDEEAERLRRTPPLFKASLTGAGPAKVIVHVESQNFIPFEYSYRIVSENNIIVSPIFTQMAKFYPTATNPFFESPVELHAGQIKNNYLELRFTFKSLSYDELHLPGHGGDLTFKYRIEPDNSLTPLN